MGGLECEPLCETLPSVKQGEIIILYQQIHPPPLTVQCWKWICFLEGKLFSWRAKSEWGENHYGRRRGRRRKMSRNRKWKKEALSLYILRSRRHSFPWRMMATKSVWFSSPKATCCHLSNQSVKREDSMNDWNLWTNICLKRRRENRSEWVWVARLWNGRLFIALPESPTSLLWHYRVSRWWKYCEVAWIQPWISRHLFPYLTRPVLLQNKRRKCGAGQHSSSFYFRFLPSRFWSRAAWRPTASWTRTMTATPSGRHFPTWEEIHFEIKYIFIYIILILYQLFNNKCVIEAYPPPGIFLGGIWPLERQSLRHGHYWGPWTEKTGNFKL